MGLQFLYGGSGAGKSTRIFEKVIKQSVRQPEKNFYLMVPDQFTMYTEKELCRMHPCGGTMNISVLSFSRMIYRVADEVGRKERTVLDDTGKNLILRTVAARKEEELFFLKEKLKRPGYIHEVKSMLSEFYQYDIHPKDLEDMIGETEGKGLLPWKLRDLKVLYEGFSDYIKEKYITTEEALEELAGMIPRSDLLRGSIVVLDGFTGFTPVQNRVIGELMQSADEVIITLCADGKEDLERGNDEHLFALSEKTTKTLTRLAQELSVPVRTPIFLEEKPVLRHRNHEAMAFLEAELFRYHNKTFTKEQGCISVYEASSPLEEVRHVCLQIRELVRTQGMCFRDIAVVTGDLSGYSHLVETEFTRYRIPFFLDQNRGVAYHPMTEYVKGALGMLRDGFTYESVMRFLRSGMSDISQNEADRLENYIRAYGIRGRKAYERMFVRGQEAQDMNDIREKMMEELSPLLVRCRTAKEYAQAVALLCQKAALQSKCNAYAKRFRENGELSKAKEYEKIYPACMDLLNQIYELIGEDEMDVAEFAEVFEAGVSEIKIGTIPQSVDQVVVGDMERTRLKQMKVLFFIGVNDGVIPGKGGSGGILSDMERQLLMEQGRELAKTPRQKIFEQRLYLYQNMTKPTCRLALSYARVDNSGKGILPSYLIRVLLGLFPTLTIQSETVENEGNLAKIVSPEDGLDDFAGLLRMYLNAEVGQDEERSAQIRENLCVLLAAYRGDAQAARIRDAALISYQPKPLSPQVTRLLYKERKAGSISRLELFASCGFAHFLRYGLELSKQEEYVFDALDFGSVCHGVMERFFRLLKKENLTLSALSDRQIDEILSDAFDQYAKEYRETIFFSDARNEYRITQMKHAVARSIRTMRYQLEKGKFVPELFEQNFRLPGDMPLIGKIDRVDFAKEDGRVYVKVIDYKTGVKKFSLEEFYYGLSLQLPVYMNAAISIAAKEYAGMEVKPASMLLYRIQNPFVDEKELEGKEPGKEPEGNDTEEIEAHIRKQMRPLGLTVEDDNVIQLLDAAFLTDSDVLQVSKKKDGTFKSTSQTLPEEEFSLVLSYATVLVNKLMEQMMEGDVAIRPVHVEKEAYDSCSFCDYRSVCGMDAKIPGLQCQELPRLGRMAGEERMKHAVYGGSAEGHNDTE